MNKVEEILVPGFKWMEVSLVIIFCVGRKLSGVSKNKST